MAIALLSHVEAVYYRNGGLYERYLYAQKLDEI